MKKFVKLTSILAIALVAVLCFALAACQPKTSAVVVNIKLTDEQYAFGVKKGDTQLKDDVNRILKKIKDNGQMEEIMNKYFADSEITPIESATKDANKDQLVVATNAAFAPFEYKMGSKYAGIDIEIAKIIADELGKELVIEDMDFTAVVTSVGNGQCDIAMAGLTVTEDRKVSVDFTDTYYNASQMLIVMYDDERFKDCKTADDVIKTIKGIEGSVKIGFQNGTTGQYYVTGDEGMGFEGLQSDSITGKGYDNGALAVKDMINGNIQFVIIDEMPAKAIVKQFKR